MTGKRASSTDVARLAGVSQSAVSRAFSPGGTVSAPMRDRVHAAAAELGYRPNALARSLITRRTQIIAVMTGDIANPHYARTINTFSLGLQERGYHVMLFSLIEGQSVAAAVEEVLTYRVDGVLMISAALSAQVGAACAQVGVPVVLYNRYASQPGVSSVRIENVDGGRAVAAHLLREGHRRIAFVAGSSVDATSPDRERGFVAALAEAGVTPVGRVEGQFTFEGGQAAMHALWSSPKAEQPTAIFAASDLMAFGALDAARHALGLDVPGDLSIVGFDDLPAAGWPSYDLTTIRQPVEEMAVIALDLLMRRIESGTALPETRLLPGTLVVRGSTGSPRT